MALLRRYPLEFRIGSDICHIPRIRGIIQLDETTVSQPKLNKFLMKLFTPPEFEVFYHQKRHLDGLGIIAQYLSGRWAAKEAIIKADTRRITKSHIIINKTNDRKPLACVLDEPIHFRLWNRYLDQERISVVRKTASGFLKKLDDITLSPETINLLRNPQGKEVDVSISHDGDYATATAIVPDEFPLVKQIKARSWAERSYLPSPGQQQNDAL